MNFFWKKLLLYLIERKPIKLLATFEYWIYFNDIDYKIIFYHHIYGSDYNSHRYIDKIVCNDDYYKNRYKSHKYYINHIFPLLNGSYSLSELIKKLDNPPITHYDIKNNDDIDGFSDMCDNIIKIDFNKKKD